MGLISKKMYDNLNIVRKIRNEFAHEIVGSSFENEQIKLKVENDLMLGCLYLPSGFLLHL